MSALEKLVASVLAAAVLAVAGALYVHHLGAEQYDAGYAAAVADGKERRDSDAAAALAIESGLRTKLATQDLTAFQKEQAYASSLEAAQRRVRAGTDSLRCPAGPVPAAAPAGNRPAAGRPESEAERPGIVPEVASDLLGIAGDVAGLVRRYDRVVERFEACRAVNAQ